MAFDHTSRTCSDVLKQIATDCERMNDFACTLRKNQFFVSVMTGTDLRLYESGWKFEKYVEAVLDQEEGFTAVWWFELNEEEKRWKLSANTSISYGDYDDDIETKYADTLEELVWQMNVIIDRLLQTYDSDQKFRKEIDRIINEKLCSVSKT